MTLTDLRSGRDVEWIGLALREISDFGEPRAEWSATGRVSVKDLDDRAHLSVTLDPKREETR